MAVTSLWSKVTVEAWTPPLCQTIVSPGPWAWRAYHKGLVGLPVITLHKVWAYLAGNFGAVSEAQTLPRGPFHLEMSGVAHKEMKSALPCCHYQLLETVSKRHLWWHLTSRRNLGHLVAVMSILSVSVEHKLPRAATSHR